MSGGTGAAPGARSVPGDSYAPFGLDPEEARDLVEDVVETADGRVVLHRSAVLDDAGPAGDAARASATVMLHGAAGSWTTWLPLRRAVREAGDDASALAGPLVLIDLPGWGASPAPAVALDVHAASRVVHAVADACGLDRFDLVGHSLGALVALHVAAQSPERVRSLGLVSPTTFSALEAASRPWRGLRTVPALVLLRVVFRVLPRASGPLLAGAARIGLLRALSAPVFRHVRRVPRSVLEEFVAEIRPRAFVAAVASGVGYDTGAWARISCPVAVVAGAEDAFAQPDDLVRLRDLLPEARTTVLVGCGHFAHVERPRETVRALSALR
ncbi:alpha/beta fold hydrolase [Frigoribacterium sp. PvP032]|uniref:alpha/beta fold hydrolase n=1 Tax=Frigoribacterium sp. PvP032 TaxID=2806589 RepID=UPI001AE28554|nr:alpha/beta hydrolase [Frigoribacterium sp. PvP032]MBP1191229.1 pimeloyl-ACP methyl ester carboxylesterase [Frigoribacterium sp. PvP032]